MKKVFLVFLVLSGLIPIGQQVFAQTEEEAKIELIKNDPDWQTIAKSQGQVINSFVSGKIDIPNFDFNNEPLFLKTINMSKEEYLNQVQLNKEAAKRLMSKFDMSGGKCSICNKAPGERITALKSVLISFQNNPGEYSVFKEQSLGIEKAQTGIKKTQNVSAASFACCGFWYYVCATGCTIALTSVGPFLLCLAYCVRTECCKPVAN